MQLGTDEIAKKAKFRNLKELPNTYKIGRCPTKLIVAKNPPKKN